MIPSKKSRENALKSTNRATNENPPKIPSKITEKEKRQKRRIWHEIEKEDFTMNILAKSSYKPLPRITNLGWQKAPTKSHSLLSSSHQEHSKKKEHTHLSSQKEMAAQPGTPPTYRALQTKDLSAPTLGVTTQAHVRAFWSTHD
jgi:hypothetical protein